MTAYKTLYQPILQYACEILDQYSKFFRVLLSMCKIRPYSIFSKYEYKVEQSLLIYTLYTMYTLQHCRMD